MLPTTMPSLASGLVLLRPFELGDAPLVARAATDPLIPPITTVPLSGSEAEVRAYIARAITLHEVQRLQLFVEPWNEGSWRGAEACGYQREGLLRRWERVSTELKDMYVYSFIPPRD